MPYHQTNNVVPGEAVTVKIDVPVPLREEPKFPKEKWKTFVCKYTFCYIDLITTRT